MNLLHTNKCECGVELCGKHIKPPLFSLPEVGVHDVNFYGGNVKSAAHAKCECGKEYIVFLRPVNNGYSVIDIALKGDVRVQKKQGNIGRPKKQK